jgi:Ca2+/Na+ antiporter
MNKTIQSLLFSTVTTIIACVIEYFIFNVNVTVWLGIICFVICFVVWYLLGSKIERLTSKKV